MDFKKELNSDISKDILTLTAEVNRLEEKNKKLLDNKTVLVLQDGLDNPIKKIISVGELDERLKLLMEEKNEALQQGRDALNESYKEATEQWGKVQHITDKWWYKLFY